MQKQQTSAPLERRTDDVEKLLASGNKFELIKYFESSGISRTTVENCFDTLVQQELRDLDFKK